MDTFVRSALLIGEENINILKHKTIMIFGCGGVGSYVIEGLVRTGIENFILIDNDTISHSNINRQIIADLSTVGTIKTQACKDRILKINSNCKVVTYETFILPETINQINFENVDYIVDCIDTISGKIAKEVLDIMIETNKNAKQIVEEKGLQQNTNTDEIEKLADEIIANNQKQVEQYKAGNERLFGFFVGQIMKATGGKINPQMANEILKKKLN